MFQPTGAKCMQRCKYHTWDGVRIVATVSIDTNLLLLFTLATFHSIVTYIQIIIHVKKPAAGVSRRLQR